MTAVFRAAIWRPILALLPKRVVKVDTDFTFELPDDLRLPTAYEARKAGER